MAPFVHVFSKILLRQKRLMEGLRFLLGLVALTNRNWGEHRSNESDNGVASIRVRQGLNYDAEGGRSGGRLIGVSEFLICLRIYGNSRPVSPTDSKEKRG